VLVDVELRPLSVELGLSDATTIYQPGEAW